MISPVSFSAVQGSNFADLVSKPQAYTRTETPAAASGLNNKEGKKSGVKKVALGVVTVAAILTALGFCARKGIFTSDKIKQEWLKKGLGYLDKAGNKIADIAVQVKDKVMALFKNKPAEAAEAVADGASEAAEKAAEVIEKAVEATV